jgi:diadenosine tetraphosphate (Ap4A) HIT family hydrolase
MPFVMDKRLEESSFFIMDFPLCRVALRNDSTYPWLYLVPRRENVREIFDLGAQDQNLLIQEIAKAASGLNAIYKPEKINTAALGNMVPQLHVHVFARFKNDPAWPRPVWAVQADEIPYTESAKELELTKLKEFFARI